MYESFYLSWYHTVYTYRKSVVRKTSVWIGKIGRCRTFRTSYSNVLIEIIGDWCGSLCESINRERACVCTDPYGVLKPY